ncbi:PUA-like domain-containing protein [Polychytrium aggregatum]|uniref:PUA-like domain-containing protein n=1 Tax=Polychytrium aggregatum TaxID=110093 RepID=UPI0022FEEF85|nr:PUA-like domain-containing protein [Polychytrium aggregatum]KAI9193664.1 PUA-like domain-containing protein [Polychytrium aggregatum]
MFKTFTIKDGVSGQTLVKSSVARGIRSKILEQYPALNPHIEEILPKKAQITLLKGEEHLNIVSHNGEMLFFNHYDGSYYPNLHLLHKYPDILPKVQVDRGAIKFVLRGANIMCPGLTSPGAQLDAGIPEGTVVAIQAEAKESAVAVGIMKMSSDDIISTNKGIGVDNIHYIGDGLWKGAQ